MAGPPKPLTIDATKTGVTAPTVQMPVPQATAGTAMVPVTPAPTVNNSLTLSTPPGGQLLTLESISQVGLTSQNGVAEISKRLGGVTKTSQLGEVGELMGQTLMAAKGYDPANMKGGLFGLIKRKVEAIRQGYETAESTMDRLTAEMDGRLALHVKRDGDIEQMITANQKYYEDLGNDIKVLDEKLTWMEANVPTADGTDVMQAQKVQDWNMVTSMGRKHLTDLDRSRAICVVFDAQLKGFKTTGTLLTSKLRSFKTTTLPVLRQTFFNYIVGLEQQQSAKISDSVDNLTNEAMMKNAASYGTTMVAVHTTLARSNVSLEAIQANYKATIQAAEDVKRIQNDMKVRLATEAPQIEAASRELAQRLAQA